MIKRRRKTKAGLPNPRPRMQNHVIPHQRMRDRHLGEQPTKRTHLHTLANIGLAHDDGVISNAGPLFNDDLGADHTGLSHHHPIRHNGRRMLKRFLRIRRRGIQQTRRFGIGQIGLIRHQSHRRLGQGVGQIGLNKTGPRLRCGQVLDVFSIAQKRHIRGAGMGNGGHIA